MWHLYIVEENGTLSYSELKKFLNDILPVIPGIGGGSNTASHHRHQLPESVYKQIIKEVDKDRLGKVGKKEVMNFVRK